jgi:hypothetical protein
MHMAKGFSEEEVLEFWKGIGEKRGGETSIRSFGKYLGRAGDGKSSAKTGLLYLAADSLWFETIDSPATFFGFAFPGGESKNRYEPFELEISLAEIEGAVSVGLSEALACVRGKRTSWNIRPLGFWGGFFDARTLQLKLRDGNSLFFEASRDKEIKAMLDGLKKG